MTPDRGSNRQHGPRLSAALIAAMSATWIALAGCAASTPTTPPPTDEASSGGETPSTTAEGQIVMRATTPIAVPQPAIPRERLRSEIQRIWEDVELAVALAPPLPPQESSSSAIESWASEALLPWGNEKRQAIEKAESHATTIAQWSGEEQGLVAGLFGYLYEDMASGLRGAPVPNEIATDPELLQIYIDTIQELLGPYALESAKAYAVCAQELLALGDSPWSEWAEYCALRAQDVATVYELTASPE